MSKECPNYALRCLRCGLESQRGILAIQCSHCRARSFLRAHYEPSFLLDGSPEQFTSYRAWLPFALKTSLPGLRIGCFRASELGARLGLEHLWFLVSGYAPHHGADLSTCTFKILEAAGVMLRVLTESNRTLIISSAGNTGCAVLELGVRNQIPAVVVVPENAIPGMFVSSKPTDRAPLLIALKNATYPDAIRLVGEMQERFGMRVVREGGAYNVARRDAMGVPVLRAVQAIGKIPDHYFQAVGSGTGGIAAHEAALRLETAGFTGGPMKLHLVQNAPFTPMVEAWKSGAQDVTQLPRKEVLARSKQTYTQVLANASPPYAVTGGVRDVLQKTRGEMYAVSNAESRAAFQQIHSVYDLEPYPESAAAFAGLHQAVKTGLIAPQDTILVHLTGCGWQRSVHELNRQPYPVAHRFAFDDSDGVSRAIKKYLDDSGAPDIPT